MNLHDQYSQPYTQTQVLFKQILQNLSHQQIYQLEKHIKFYQLVASHIWADYLICNLIIQQQMQQNITYNISHEYIKSDYICIMTSFFIDHGLTYWTFECYKDALELIHDAINIGNLYINKQTNNNLKMQESSIDKAFYNNVWWRYGSLNYSQNENFNTYVNQYIHNQPVYDCQSIYEHTDNESVQQIDQVLHLYHSFIQNQYNRQQLYNIQQYISRQMEYLGLAVINAWSSVKEFLGVLHIDYQFIRRLNDDLIKIKMQLQELAKNTVHQQMYALDKKIAIKEINNESEQQFLSLIIQSVMNTVILLQSITEGEKQYDDILSILVNVYDILQMTDQLNSKMKKNIFQICINYYSNSVNMNNNKLNLILLALSCIIQEHQVEPIINIIINSDLYIEVIKHLILQQRTSTVKIMMMYYLFRLALTDENFKRSLLICVQLAEKYFLSYKKRLLIYLKHHSDQQLYTKYLASFCVIYIDFITNNITDESYILKYRIQYEYGDIQGHQEDEQFIRDTVSQLLTSYS